MTDYEAWIILYVVLMGMAENDDFAPLATTLAVSTAIGYWFWFNRTHGMSALRSLIPGKSGTQVGAATPTTPEVPS